MHSLNDCEVWKRRAEEIRREVEKNRLAGRESSRRSRTLLRDDGSEVATFGPDEVNLAENRAFEEARKRSEKRRRQDRL